MSKTREGAIFLTISSAVFMASGYLGNIFIGRTFGPSTYGLYAVVITILTSINLFQSSGLPQAVSRKIAQSNSSKGAILRAAIRIQLILTLVLAALLALLSPVIAGIMNDPQLQELLVYLAFVLPAYGLFTIMVGYFNGLGKFKSQASMTLAYSILKLGFIVLLSLFFGIKGVIIAFAISPLLVLAAFLRPVKEPGVYSYKSLIIEAVPLAVFSFLFTLAMAVDLFYLKSSGVSSLDLGLYGAAQNVALIPYFLLGALALITFPVIAKHISSNNLVAAGSAVTSALRHIFAFAIPLTVLIILTATPAATFLFGSKFSDAGPYIQVLAIGYLAFIFSSVFSSVLNAAGRASISAIVMAISIILTILISSVTLRTQGPIGAAIALTLSGIIDAIILTVLTYRRLKFSFDFWGFGKVAIGTTFVLLISLLPISPVLLKWVLCGVIYVVAELLLKEQTITEYYRLGKNLVVQRMHKKGVVQ